MTDNTLNIEDVNISALKIFSLNVRGLRNPRKRRILFHAIKKEKFDIICFQETYLTENDRKTIEKEWSHSFHLSGGSKNSKGLLTLFNKTIPVENITLKSSNDRCLISQISFNNTFVTFLNIYAPCVTKEKSDFLFRIKNIANDYVSNDLGYYILAGDFNSVSNNKLDIISGDVHNSKTVDDFNSFINDLLLIDIWREFNPKRKEFSWSRSNPFIARRIDYIFVSEGLLPFCKDPYIKHYGFSDHKATTLNVDFSSFQRGPSFYKFNKCMLNNVNFVNDVTNEIERIKSFDMEPHLCWEYIKFSIKDIAITHGKSLAYNRKVEKNNLISKLTELERHITIFPSDEDALKAYNLAKNKFELNLILETEGARIRSGQKWAQDGEKCSKYFLNLEKQRSNCNTIFNIENHDCPAGFSKSPLDILTVIRNHFKSVYSSPTDSDITHDNVFVDDSGANVLDVNDVISLNKDLSEQELLTALKSLNNNSAPGLDGLPSEIYKFFWKDIKQPLLEAFNHSFLIGELSQSQCDGVICLHHKGKGLPREKITSRRPISLTNTDYKLIAKVLALRMNKCLFKCVSPDQYAFVKGRQVADLLRELDDIVEHGKNKFPNSILLSVDYAKAFDTLSIKAIKKALSYFGFGDNFKTWIDILFSNRTCRVSNGGYISECFNMERGVRQGCPISPLLFILTLELLARDIRKNKNIIGIKLAPNASPIKIKMYADDASFFLRDQMDYREVLSRIKLFSHFSGLCLNKNKSAAMYIGDPSHDKQFKFGIKFVNKIKILGIIFSNEKAASEIKENFENKIMQLERLCCLWEKRSLTIIGKITILKCFGISLFIYIMQSIGLSDFYIKRINTIMFKFIWNSKANNKMKIIEKVKRDYICRNKESGGLGMTHLAKLQDSFYLKWADKLLTEPLSDSGQSWKIIPTHIFTPVGGLSVFNSSVQKNDFKGEILIKSFFWRRVLYSWIGYNKNDNPVQRCSIYDPIFNNSLIRFKNRPLFIEGCIKRSMIFIKDFISGGQILSFDDFRSKFGNFADTIFAYNIIYNALNNVKDIINENYFIENDQENFSQFHFRDLKTGNITRKSYYNMIRDNEVISVHNSLRTKFDVDEQDSELWLIPFKSVSEVKLIQLQWKLLHNIYPTGTLLYKMKIKNNENCDICGERDTPLHCFVLCPIAKEVWKDAENCIFKISSQVIKLNEKIIMIGLFNDTLVYGRIIQNLVNKICLIGKFSISKYRYFRQGKISILFEKELLLRNMIMR